MQSLCLKKTSSKEYRLHSSIYLQAFRMVGIEVASVSDSNISSRLFAGF